MVVLPLWLLQIKELGTDPSSTIHTRVLGVYRVGPQLKETGARPGAAAGHSSLLEGLCFLLTWRGAAAAVARLGWRSILKERAGDLDLCEQV